MRKYEQHFLILSFPSQGNINPSLQLANRLINLNDKIEVTFATTVAAARRMIKTPTTTTTKPLSFATYFDDENLKPVGANDFGHFMSELKRCGSKGVADLITSAANQGRPFTFVIYSLMLDWTADIAAAFGIGSAFFFAQPATVLALYFYYFHGYGDTISKQLLQLNSTQLQLPGLPLLKSGDLPSFFSPSSPHAFITPSMREQFEFLGRQTTKPTVLVNTFDALEPQALRAIDELKTVAIGPLVPTNDDASLGNLFQDSVEEDYIGWLNSKAESSVVYVSFGSLCVLSGEQEEEVLHGLLESGHQFLWVMRSNNIDEEKLGELVEGKGKIVSWCCQIEVLSHGSLGCFMTHCGWNSTIEGLSLGVPMVGFPMQIDQPTNGKLVEDVWKTGLRVKPNSHGIVERGEIRGCLDLVMGCGGDMGKKEEIMKNAKQWKDLGREAIGEGGTSYLNLKAFIDEIGGN